MQSCKCIPMTVWWKDKRENQVEEKLSDLIENTALNFLCSVLCEGLHVFILSPNEQQMMLLTLTFPNWKWVCGCTTPVAGAGECSVLALPALVPISLVGTRGESLKIKPKHFLTFNMESHNSYMCAHVHVSIPNKMHFESSFYKAQSSPSPSHSFIEEKAILSNSVFTQAFAVSFTTYISNGSRTVPLLRLFTQLLWHLFVCCSVKKQVYDSESIYEDRVYFVSPSPLLLA